MWNFGTTYIYIYMYILKIDKENLKMYLYKKMCTDSLIILRVRNTHTSGNRGVNDRNTLCTIAYFTKRCARIHWSFWAVGKVRTSGIVGVNYRNTFCKIAYFANSWVTSKTPSGEKYDCASTWEEMKAIIWAAWVTLLIYICIYLYKNMYLYRYLSNI